MQIGPFEIMLTASTLLELNPLFQSVRIFKRKDASDVSITTYLMILAIGIMWFIYGLRIASLPLIVGNAIKLVASLSVIVTCLVFQRKAGV